MTNTDNTFEKPQIDKVFPVLRVCIGTEPKTAIPCKVLQHSILKHLSPAYQVEFYLMQGESWRSKPTLGLGTGFSLLRWQIPEYFQYKGTALYLDADQLVFADISQLFLELHPDPLTPNPKSLACTYQKDKWFPQPPYAPNTSVMLIDCERIKSDPGYMTYDQIVNYLQSDQNRQKYVQVMHALHLKTLPAKISSDWNCLNTPSQNCKLLHYTEEHKQPWYNPAHPHKNLWRDLLLEALKAEVISKAEVVAACQSYEPHTKSKRGTGMHPYWLKFVK